MTETTRAATETAVKRVVARTPYRECPICGTGTINKPFAIGDCRPHPLYHPGIPEQQHWVRCQDCRHVFTDGYFEEQALEAVFKKAHAGQVAGGEIEKQRFTVADTVERICRAIGRHTGSWLDVGAGNGALSLTAQEFGFSVTAVEARRESAESLMDHPGIRVFATQFASLPGLGTVRFDVITMADVLEHMPYPRLGIRKARALIAADGSRDGVLFVSCPNMDSAAWRSMEPNPYWWEVEHYHNFTRDSLYRLLREEGFAPDSYAVSRRYRAGMEVIARPIARPS